jgi:hypothetical protein
VVPGVVAGALLGSAVAVGAAGLPDLVVGVSEETADWVAVVVLRTAEDR